MSKKKLIEVVISDYMRLQESLRNLLLGDDVVLSNKEAEKIKKEIEKLNQSQWDLISQL